MQKELNVINSQSLFTLKELDPKVKSDMNALNQIYDPNKLMSIEDRAKYDREQLPKYAEALKGVSDETLLMFLGGTEMTSSSISNSRVINKEVVRRIKEAANGNQEVLNGKHFETLLYMTTSGRNESNEFATDHQSILENNNYIDENRGKIEPENIELHEFKQNVELNDVQNNALENYRNFQQENTNSGERAMADDNKIEAANLGQYHDLFFKLGGTDKTAEEYAAISDSKEIDRIKEVYEAWVAKYINVDENTPEENKEAAAEESYFNKREEEIENMPTDTMEQQAAKGRAKIKFAKECDAVGRSYMEVSFTAENGETQTRTAHFDPHSAQFDEMPLAEIEAYFKEKFENEAKGEKKEPEDEKDKEAEKDKDKEDKETDVLDISEKDKESEKDGNQDWKDEKEAFWKEHCGEHAQECERDPEDKDGLTLDIYKSNEEKAAKKPMARVHYSSKNKASIQGSDGKVADYSVFLGLAKDAKRNNQAINFDGEMTPEFAAKLKLACEEVGVGYQNAPEGKIDANTFAGELSPETLAKLEEYNKSQEKQPEPTNEDKPKTYADYLAEMKEKTAKGEEIDISNLEGAEKVIAYAAAMVATNASQKDDIEIKGAPEKTIGFKNEKIFEVDDNGDIKKTEDGKPIMTANPIYEATKNLPEEATTALEGFNQGIRQKQVEAARSKVNGTAERDRETARREEFRGTAEKNGYDPNKLDKENPDTYKSKFTHYEKDGNNTADAAKARQEAMAKYWANKKQNG